MVPVGDLLLPEELATVDLDFGAVYWIACAELVFGRFDPDDDDEVLLPERLLLTLFDTADTAALPLPPK